jgi:hypothetical protein
LLKFIESRSWAQYAFDDSQRKPEGNVIDSLKPPDCLTTGVVLLQYIGN